MAEAAVRLLGDDAARGAMLDAALRHIAEETSFTEYAFDLLALAGKPVPRISVIVPSYNYQDYIRARHRKRCRAGHADSGNHRAG
jgi:hypothetical protein